MPHVYRTPVEAWIDKAPQESPTVRPRTMSSTPPEPYPLVGEPSHNEADMPHADAHTVSGPLSGTHLYVTMIPPHHHPYQCSCPLSPFTRLSLRRVLCDLFGQCTTCSGLPPCYKFVRPLRHFFTTFQKAKNQWFFFSSYEHCVISLNVFFKHASLTKTACYKHDSPRRSFL